MARIHIATIPRMRRRHPRHRGKGGATARTGRRARRPDCAGGAREP
ncbi:hypothetical protein BURMUCF1_0431, partial [Burkholderia multivorans ATCC BAA-247]